LALVFLSLQQLSILALIPLLPQSLYGSKAPGAMEILLVCAKNRFDCQMARTGWICAFHKLAVVVNNFRRNRLANRQARVFDSRCHWV